MKKLATLCLAACLAAALATPAGALDYAIDAPEGPDYGKPTSVEVVHTADGGAPVSYTHLDVYKRQLWYVVCLPEERTGKNYEPSEETEHAQGLR